MPRNAHLSNYGWECDRGFEQDGNFAVDTQPNLDWAGVSATKVVDDTLDSGFQGSSKEEDPANWTCNTGGDDPGKGNILRAYANPRIGPGSANLNLVLSQTPSDPISGSSPLRAQICEVTLLVEDRQAATVTPH